MTPDAIARLVEFLHEEAENLDAIDRHASGARMDHGIMTTIRMEKSEQYREAAAALLALQAEVRDAERKGMEIAAKICDSLSEHTKIYDEASEGEVSAIEGCAATIRAVICQADAALSQAGEGK